MTNIYLTDSDEEAIFLKEQEDMVTIPMDTLKTRPGRNAFGRISPTAASCLSKCHRLGSN